MKSYLISAQRKFGLMRSFDGHTWIVRFALSLVMCTLIGDRFCATLQAQSIPTNANYLLRSDLPPGAVGAAQASRRTPAQGYFQPVQVSGPKGLSVALAQDGQFLPLLEAPVRAGMLVGHVYRIKVSGIPGYEGEELFPTIEVIDRVYAPVGREHRFPIPVVLEEEDLRAALSGELVTRVIYLEDAETAEPVADSPGQQRVIDVAGLDDPLQAADQLGRPVAIVRIGSRTPDFSSDLNDFLYGSPPWLPIKPIPERQKLIDNNLWPATPAIESPNAQPTTSSNEPAQIKSTIQKATAPPARPGNASIEG
jgi:hypothetical protein